MNIEQLPDYPAIKEIAAALWGTGEIRGAAVMIGAGFSRFAELPAATTSLPPLWNNFRDEMLAALYEANPGHAPSDPLRLAEEYRAMHGPVALERLVRDKVRDSEWQPGILHRSLLRLPWADVLTTNWDTLLERTVDPDSGRTYANVLTTGDIARTRSPRIVKLHGSFPSLSPFIFTEEDFRTYPTSFAPFVNLAQQVLLENELCLLGFSGDDPNFLAWSGWVRDHLGDKARRIHLIGVLNISPSQRRMLEQRNVSIVDLTPLVRDEDAADRHRVAVRHFLESLHRAKPAAPWIWDRSRRARTPENESLDQLVERWRLQREAYPGWLVAPYMERYQLRTETADQINRIVFSIGKLGPDLRRRLCMELIWRCSTGTAGLSDVLVALVQRLLDDTTISFDRAERFTIALALVRCYRERRDRAAFERILAFAEPFAVEEDRKAELAYERCLWARDRMDYASMAAHVDKIKGNDPVWALRRALVLCHLGRAGDAGAIVKAAHADIKLRRLRDRHSLWLLSRQSWIHFIARNTWFADPGDDGEDPFVDWPQVYAEAKCDPWDELQSIRSDIDKDASRADSAGVREVAQYDPGSWRTVGGGTHYLAGFVVEPYDELRRLVDLVGLAQFPRIDVVGSSFERAAKLLDFTQPRAVWANVLALRSKDGLIDERFNRTGVALLDIELVRELVMHLKAAIEYGRTRLWEGEPDDDGHRRVSEWIGRVCRRLELLSRLVVKLGAEEAETLFKWGIDLAHQADWVHWWLFEPLNHLLERAMTAIPPSGRAKLTEDMLNLPLLGEKDAKGLERDWPELGENLITVAHLIVRPPDGWSARVAQLIQAARTGKSLDRTRALIRLLVLVKAKALTDLELAALDAAIWSTAKPNGHLPDDAELLPYVWIELAVKSSQRAVEAFRQDIVKPLRAGKLLDLGFQSLSMIAHRGYFGVPVILEHDAALEITKHVLKWRPQNHERDHRGTGGDQDLAFSSARALADAVLPALKATDFDEPFCSAFLGAAGEAAFPHLAIAVPFVAINAPANAAAAIRIIRRTMVVRDREIASMGVRAVQIWARLARKAGSEFPAILASDIANLCGARHDSSLLSALNVSRDLISHGYMSEQDIERLDQALDLLLVDAAYQSQRDARLNAVTLTLVRSECVRLSQQLVGQGHDSGAARAWLEQAPSDPLPEVRLAIVEDV